MYAAAGVRESRRDLSAAQGARRRGVFEGVYVSARSDRLLVGYARVNVNARGGEYLRRKE